MASRRKKSIVEGATVEPATVATSAPRSGPLVFVSHDNRDADLAEGFANLLSDVSGGTLKSFRSSDNRGTSGIAFGTEWYTTIMSRLDEATDVVALLTAQSVDRPWILYEAGVAKGKLGTTVFGLALGVPLEKVGTGPFGQFQNSADDEDSLTKLVMQLLERNPDASPREPAIRLQVKLFRETASQVLQNRGKSQSKSAAQEPNTAKLFEEVKAMVRELPDRIQAREDTVPVKARRSRRFDPRMLEEVFFLGSRESEDYSAGWLLVLSFVKDDLPWLSEIGLEFYRKLQQRNLAPARKVSRQIHSLLEIVGRHPMFLDVSGRDEERMHFTVRFLHDVVERSIDQAEAMLASPQEHRKS